MFQAGCRLERHQNKSIELTEEPEDEAKLSSVKTKDRGRDKLPGAGPEEEKRGQSFTYASHHSLAEASITFNLEVL